jgi:hypothetical protein
MTSSIDWVSSFLGHFVSSTVCKWCLTSRYGLLGESLDEGSEEPFTKLSGHFFSKKSSFSRS